MADDSLLVEADLYAGGSIIAGGYLVYIHTRDRYTNPVNLPSRRKAAEWYRLTLEFQGGAGPAGWLAYQATLFDEQGQLVGRNTPGLLFARPWPVPSVLHFPQVAPELPIFTATLKVMSGRATLECGPRSHESQDL